VNKENLDICQGIEVPVSPVLTPIRESGYGHVEGLPDEELLTGAELERWVYLQEFGPILALPRPKQDCFFRPNGFDDNGMPDWGAFGTVDFERYSGGFNKRLYKADKLKERLKDKSIVFEIVSERIHNIEKYTVLQYLKAGTIKLEHIQNENMHALAEVFLQICRLTTEIIELKKKAWAKNKPIREVV
jgi:hypothetical protein